MLLFYSSNAMHTMNTKSIVEFDETIHILEKFCLLEKMKRAWKAGTNEIFSYIKMK